MEDAKKMSYELLQEAILHRATTHPYLITLESGGFKRPTRCIEDLAMQYGEYSAWFPKYLTTVMSKLDDPNHRLRFVENLSEESGKLDEEEVDALKTMGIEIDWVQGVPHTELFKRFQEAAISSNNRELCDSGIIWRELFYALLVTGSPAESVGAIGLGTESIVKYIFKHITSAIKNHTSISREKYVFFELHCEVDDKHGDILIDVTNDLLATDPSAYNDIRKGMLKALHLRCMFWDSMHNRAKAL